MTDERNPSCIERCTPCETERGSCLECCCCVPTKLCVDLTAYGECECNASRVVVEFDLVDDSYSGAIPCGGQAIDFRFYFDIGDDGRCRFCLESECLGLLGDYVVCHEVDDSGQQSCERLEFDFQVDGPACGLYCDSFVLSTKAADFLDRRDIEEDDPCQDCTCLCRCLCVGYHYHDPPGPVYRETLWVCMDQDTHSWRDTIEIPSLDPIDFEIFLVDLSDGGCGLRIETDYADGDAQAITCPDGINTYWPVGGSQEIIFDIWADCAFCGDCGYLPCQGCCECAPDTLTATLSNVLNCSCANGIQITLDETGTDPDVREWTGSGTVCGTSLDLTLRCPIQAGSCEDWTLEYSFGNGCAPDATLVPMIDPPCGCPPVSICFRIGPLQACCGPSGPPQYNFNVCITE